MDANQTYKINEGLSIRYELSSYYSERDLEDVECMNLFFESEGKTYPIDCLLSFTKPLYSAKHNAAVTMTCHFLSNGIFESSGRLYLLDLNNRQLLTIDNDVYNSYAVIMKNDNIYYITYNKLIKYDMQQKTKETIAEFKGIYPMYFAMEENLDGIAIIAIRI